MDKPVLTLANGRCWNVDVNNIDLDGNAFYIIEKVIGWGTHTAFAGMLSFYGKERIRKEVVNTKILGDKEVNFCCFPFDLKIEDFKYYKPGLLRSNIGFINEFSDYNYYN